MKLLSILTAVLALSFTMVATDADAARRLGGGKSTGMQRQSVDSPKAATAAPAQSAAPAAAANAPAAAAQAAGKRSWMGPIAGLAAGLGLAALASHFGFGEALANMMMMGLLAMAVVAAIAYFMRRRGASTQPMNGGMGSLQLAGAGANPTPMARTAFEPAQTGSASGAAFDTAGSPAGAAGNTIGNTTGNIPADFDRSGFERNAKVNFIRLQAANDAGNLDDIRAFTTPEMFAEIRLNMAERGTEAQVTDVVSIEACVIDVAEEASAYVVSVRFSGQVREDGQAPEAIDEIWHMTKPRNGDSGWLLAGIQQAQ